MVNSFTIIIMQAKKKSQRAVTFTCRCPNVWLKVIVTLFLKKKRSSPPPPYSLFCRSCSRSGLFLFSVRKICLLYGKKLVSGLIGNIYL